MAHKCKVCGDEMVYRVGDHYRDTGQGMKLYKGVRLYSCPNGCPETYYDYRHARPADRPERILGFIRAPRGVVNVIDPLLAGGLILGSILLIVGFLASRMSITGKVLAIVAIVSMAVWLMNFMGGRPQESTPSGADDGSGQES